MAILKCKECSGVVSEHADKCPHCGAPRSVFKGDPKKKLDTSASLNNEKVVEGTQTAESAPEKRKKMLSCPACARPVTGVISYCIHCKADLTATIKEVESIRGQAEPLDGDHNQKTNRFSDSLSEKTEKFDDPFSKYDDKKSAYNSGRKEEGSSGIIEELSKKNSSYFEAVDKKETQYSERKAMRGLELIRLNTTLFAAWLVGFVIINFLSVQIVRSGIWLSSEFERASSGASEVAIILVIVISAIQAYSRIGLSFVFNSSKIIIMNLFMLLVGYSAIHTLLYLNFYFDDILYNQLLEARSASKAREAIQAHYIGLGLLLPAFASGLLAFFVNIKHHVKGDL